VVNTNLSLIEATPRLIIDLRYNGGGADISYRPLKRLIYTNPVKTVGVDVVATKENLDIYARMIRAAELPPADEKEYLGILEQARNSGQRLYNFYPDQFDTVGVVLKYPSVVAVIMNEKVGSTAEEFLLEARQSKKVKLFGNHSQGVLDYANVCVKAFECFAFDLHYPISRSRRIDQGAGIDNVGIKPDVPVDLSREDWFQQVLQRM
jgi:C-terminal processing protease CtpA/Prc